MYDTDAADFIAYRIAAAARNNAVVATMTDDYDTQMDPSQRSLVTDFCHRAARLVFSVDTDDNDTYRVAVASIARSGARVLTSSHTGAGMEELAQEIWGYHLLNITT